MTRLERLHDVNDCMEAALRSLPHMVFDYIEGGADSESTVRENRAAFERVRLLPSAPAKRELLRAARSGS